MQRAAVPRRAEFSYDGSTWKSVEIHDYDVRPVIARIMTNRSRRHRFSSSTPPRLRTTIVLNAFRPHSRPSLL